MRSKLHYKHYTYAIHEMKTVTPIFFVLSCSVFRSILCVFRQIDFGSLYQKLIFSQDLNKDVNAQNSSS